MTRPGQMRGKPPDRSRPGRPSAEFRILEATERLLRRMPLRDLSVEDILTESGVSRRTFYVYFASKYGVVSRLTEKVMRDIFENLAPLIRRTEDEHGPGALRRVIETGTEIWAEHREVLRAVIDHWQEVEDLREIWLATLQEISDALAVEIERERVAGAAPPGPDARALSASLVWATAHVLHVSWLQEVPALSTRAAVVVESITAMWIGAVYGPRARAS